jgi:hypothetical protein
LVLAALGFGLLAPELRAQEEAPKPVKFTADLGFVSTAGNTEVTNLNAGEKVEWNLAPITLKEGFAIVYGETDGNTTTSSLRADLRADYALSAPLAIFGAFAFDRNRFAGIARRFEENVGLAFKPIRGDRDKLEFEAGVSFNQQRSILEVSDNFTAARAPACTVTASPNRLHPAVGRGAAQSRGERGLADQYRDGAGGSVVEAAGDQAFVHHPLRQVAGTRVQEDRPGLCFWFADQLVITTGLRTKD